MLTRMRRASVFLLAVLCLGATGCATAAPPRGTLRQATDEARRVLANLLRPLLMTSGIWTGPADGCASALGIVPSPAINLGVAAHPQCKFALVVTETALQTLPSEELQAALAHELGHVALRRQRRDDERKRRDEMTEKTSVGALGAIPLIGPILAVGMAGTQMAADAGLEGQYRAYDREDELAADSYALNLLERVVGRERGCL